MSHNPPPPPPAAAHPQNLPGPPLPPHTPTPHPPPHHTPQHAIPHYPPFPPPTQQQQQQQHHAFPQGAPHGINLSDPQVQARLAFMAAQHQHQQQGAGGSGQPAIGGMPQDQMAAMAAAMGNIQGQSREAVMKQLQALQNSHAQRAKLNLAHHQLGSTQPHTPTSSAAAPLQNGGPQPAPSTPAAGAGSAAGANHAPSPRTASSGDQSAGVMAGQLSQQQREMLLAQQRQLQQQQQGQFSQPHPQTPSNPQTARYPSQPPSSHPSQTGAPVRPPPPGQQTPGQGQPGGLAGPRSQLNTLQQRATFVNTFGNYFRGAGLAPPPAIFNGERDGSFKVGDAWMDVIDLLMAVMKAGGIMNAMQHSADSPTWRPLLISKNIPNPLPYPIPAPKPPNADPSIPSHMTTDPVQYLTAAYLAWIQGFEVQMAKSRQANYQRQHAAALAAGRPPPAPLSMPTPLNGVGIGMSPSSAPSPASTLAPSPASGGMAFPSLQGGPPLTKPPQAQPQMQQAQHSSPGGDAMPPPGRKRSLLQDKVKERKELVVNTTGLVLAGAEAEVASASLSASASAAAALAKKRKRARKSETGENSNPPTPVSATATAATTAPTTAPASFPEHPPTPPKRARYRVEYRPLHFPLPALAGWDANMISSTFSKHSVRQGTRPIHDLAIVDMEAIMMGLRSRMPGEVGYAVTVLSMLSMPHPEESIGGLPLHHLRELLAELLDVLEESVFGDAGMEAWEEKRERQDRRRKESATGQAGQAGQDGAHVVEKGECNDKLSGEKQGTDLNTLPFSELERLGKDFDFSVYAGDDAYQHRREQTGGRTDRVLAVLNLLRNFAMLTDNQQLMAGNARLLVLLGAVSDARLCRFPLDEPAVEGESESTTKPYSIWELARVRRDCVSILQCLGIHVQLRAVPPATTVALFRLLATFLSSGWESNALREPLYGSTLSVSVRDAPPATQVSTDRALDAFAALAHLDGNRELLGAHVPQQELVALFQSLLKLLPLTRRHFDALHSMEDQLGYYELLALSLHSLAFLSPLPARGAMRAFPGALPLLTRVIFDTALREPDFRQNPFNILCRRLCETLGVLNGTVSPAGVVEGPLGGAPMMGFGAGGIEGSGWKFASGRVEDGWLAGSADAVVGTVMQVKGMDWVVMNELDGMCWGTE